MAKKAASETSAAAERCGGRLSAKPLRGVHWACDGVLAQGMRLALSLRAIARARRMSSLTHVDGNNMPTMVDVSAKNPTARLAVAQATVEMPLRAFQALTDTAASGAQGSGSGAAAAASTSAKELSSKKGPVLATAIIAGTMGAKRTHELIPFCHPLPLESCKFDIDTHVDEQAGKAAVRIKCSAATTNKTGVEMEALVGANVAALTVYDMCKAVTHDMKITEVKLLHKSGGKSTYNAREAS